MTYKDFPSWKKALELAKRVYEISSHWPDHEKFGLVNQIRRAAFVDEVALLVQEVCALLNAARRCLQ